jgi:hypothetical protein
VVERLLEAHRVGGSIPSFSTILRNSSTVEHPTDNRTIMVRPHVSRPVEKMAERQRRWIATPASRVRFPVFSPEVQSSQVVRPAPHKGVIESSNLSSATRLHVYASGEAGRLSSG